MRRSLGEPDPFRLRYREQIAHIVGTILRQRMNRETAIAFIRREAEPTPVEDRARLIEVAETEIMRLHEGNFARYPPNTRLGSSQPEGVPGTGPSERSRKVQTRDMLPLPKTAVSALAR